MRIVSLLLLILLATPAHAAWYADSSFIYRQKITVDNTKVNADLTDFPVYVNTDDLATGFYANAQADCGDVRITKTDETTEIARKIVFCDGTNGEIHFKAAGTLSSTVNTDYYIYYGNGTAADYATSATYGAEAVWANYMAVWHMKEDPSGAAPQVDDSTANSHDLTSSGTMTTADLVAAKLANGIDFDGTNDYLSGSDAATLEVSAVTAQGWFRLNTEGSNSTLFGRDGGASSPYKFRMQGTTGVSFQIRNTSGGYVNSPILTVGTDIISDNATWSMLHGTYISTGSNRIYNNGVEKDTGTAASGTIKIDSTQGLETGASVADGTYMGMIADELRLRSTVLTSTWISTEYNNQNSSSTFYTASAEEDVPTTAGPAFWWNGF